MRLSRPAIVAAMLAALSLSFSFSACAGGSAGPANAEAATPASAGAISASHAAAVRRLLQANHLTAYLRHWMLDGGSGDAEAVELRRHMAVHMSDEVMYASLVPLYARYVSIASANELTRYYRGSVGRREVTALLARQGVKPGEQNPAFSAAEFRQMKRAATGKAADQVAEARLAMDQVSAQLGQEWMRAHRAMLQAQALGAMRVWLLAHSARADGDTAPVPPLALTGLDSLDQLTLLMADFWQATAQVNRALSSDLASYGLQPVFAYEGLRSAQGINAARAALARAGARNEAYVAQLDSLQRDIHPRLLALPAGRRMLEVAGPGPVGSHGLLLRMAENRRQRYALFLRVQDVAALALGGGQAQAEAANAVLQTLVTEIDAGWQEDAALRAAAEQAQAWARQEREG